MVTTLDVYKEIRRLRLEGVTSQRGAAKRLGISRNTVKKYWEGDNVPWDHKPYNRDATVMTPEVVQFIKGCLDEDDANGIKKQRHTARRIYQRLVEEHGFTFTLKHGDSYTIQNLPAGTEYAVTEVSNGTSDKYTVAITGGTDNDGTGIISDTANSTVSVEATNTRNKGSLNIQKTGWVNGATPTNDNKSAIDGDYSFTITGSGDAAGVSKSITITLTNGAATAVSPTGTDGNGISASVTNGVVTISGLPTGTYAVTENLTVTQTEAGIRLLSSDNNTDIIVTANNSEDIPTAVFVNNNPFVEVSIPGTKTFEHGTMTEGQFSFTISGDTPLPTTRTAAAGANGSFSFGPITYPLSVMDNVTAVEGVKTKTFTYTITENLPTRAQEPTEEERINPGYRIINGIKYDLSKKTVTVTVTYREETGVMTATVSPDQANLGFTNEQLGSVQVTKTFSGVDALPASFKITATWTVDSTTYTEELTTATNDEHYVTVTDSGTNQVTQTDYKVSEKTGEGTANSPYTWTISNLPIGTEVTFTESGYEIAGYNVASTVTQVASGETTASTTAGTSGKAMAAEGPTLPDSAKVGITNAYTPGVELPATGGPGTLVYTVTGLTLTLGAALWLILRRKREQN